MGKDKREIAKEKSKRGKGKSTRDLEATSTMSLPEEREVHRSAQTNTKEIIWVIMVNIIARVFAQKKGAGNRGGGGKGDTTNEGVGAPSRRYRRPRDASFP